MLGTEDLIVVLYDSYLNLVRCIGYRVYSHYS